MSVLDGYFEQVLPRHADEVIAGLHDDQCEYGPGFYLCNCSKRRRERNRFTELPTEGLYFPPPACPHCGEDLNHDGDGWQCMTCPLSWNSAGDPSSCQFTDDHGDLTPCTAHGIRAHVICQQTGGPR